MGSKIHLVTDRNSLPPSLGISGANMHDSQGLDPLIRGIPPIRSRRGPRRRRPATALTKRNDSLGCAVLVRVAALPLHPSWIVQDVAGVGQAGAA